MMDIFFFLLVFYSSLSCESLVFLLFWWYYVFLLIGDLISCRLEENWKILFFYVQKSIAFDEPICKDGPSYFFYTCRNMYVTQDGCQIFDIFIENSGNTNIFFLSSARGLLHLLTPFGSLLSVLSQQGSNGSCG